MFFFDPTIVLLIPAILLAIWAQAKVKSAYAKYSQVGTRRGLTGADVAKAILRDESVHLAGDPTNYPGGQACGLQAIPGKMTDHYDPRARMLGLSEDVYHGNSIAALGIAAHEVGHAIQHARMYSPLMVRNIVYPICSLSTTLAWPLLIAGFFVFPPLLKVAVIMFTLAVFFTVITLPVEFNASSRALKALANGGYLDDEEMMGARKVLNAAALTYVAAAAMAIMQLLRVIIYARN